MLSLSPKIDSPIAPSRPARILVAEDERIVALYLQRKLEAMGHTVVGVAHSGLQSIDLALKHLPDLILMDINLDGGIDGIQAAEAIRSRISLPIVYLTAYSNRDIVARAKLTEPYGYILKPFQERELEIVIEVALYRYQTEKQFQEHRRFLAATLESIGDGVIALDPESRVTFLNPVAEKLTQWPSATAKGRKVEDVLVLTDDLSHRPVSLPVEQAMGQQVIQSVGPHAELTTRGGSTVPIECTVAPILDDRNQVLGTIITVRDISERIAASRAASKLAAIVSSSPDGIIGFDAEGVITSWNPGAERLFGYGAEEALGQKVTMLAAAEKQSEMLAVLERLLRDEWVPPFETQRRRKDGMLVPVNVAVSTVKDAEGAMIGFAGIIRDLTPLQELREQFRQAQKVEAVGMLAGGVAHDFNNVLTVINGNCHLLREDALPNPLSQEAVEEIHEAGEKAATLVKQLLAFSRRQVLEPIELNLNRVVTHSEKMLRRLIGEDVRISTGLEPNLWPILADAGQIEQVLVNLAVNSRDAMPNGGRLTIETANVAITAEEANDGRGFRAGRYVRLSVSDTGSGMSENVKARIFEPFFTTKDQGKGTGLGLAVVHGFISQCGGRVEVLSAVNAGTTFKILLPALAENEAVSTASAELTPLPREKGLETVLVVEDEESVRRIVRIALHARGYTVLEAEGAADASRVVQRHGRPIHLLVTDVVMPGPGGRHLADQLRIQYPKLRVLYVSGYFDDAVNRQGINRKTDFFLQKPFTPQGLAQKVRTVLDADR